MRTTGAVVTRAPGSYEVVDLDLDEPRRGELLIRMAAAGICHSDDHLATGDHRVQTYPWCGGHEGAGIVEQVGPDTPGWTPGDHVVFSFTPCCGTCRWCSTGHQNLCDLSATLLIGSRFDDASSFRMHMPDGRDVGQMCGLGTFAERTLVSERSAIKVDPAIPFETLCLFACSVGTGWGAAVHSGRVTPGDTVIVMGSGGVGIHAVQGARHAGAEHVLVADPVEFKREFAAGMGATRTFSDIVDAADFGRSVTNGQGADVAIVTVGVTRGEHIAQAFSAIRKAGTVVATGQGPWEARGIPVPPAELTAFQKTIVGSQFGACNPLADIPRLLSLYRAGILQADEMVTSTYDLGQIKQGFDDMHAGVNIRGVITF